MYVYDFRLSWLVGISNYDLFYDNRKMCYDKLNLQ